MCWINRVGGIQRPGTGVAEIPFVETDGTGCNRTVIGELRIGVGQANSRNNKVGHGPCIDNNRLRGCFYATLARGYLQRSVVRTGACISMRGTLDR